MQDFADKVLRPSFENSCDFKVSDKFNLALELFNSLR